MLRPDVLLRCCAAYLTMWMALAGSTAEDQCTIPDLSGPPFPYHCQVSGITNLWNGWFQELEGNYTLSDPLTKGTAWDVGKVDRDKGYFELTQPDYPAGTGQAQNQAPDGMRGTYRLFWMREDADIARPANYKNTWVIWGPCVGGQSNCNWGQEDVIYLATGPTRAIDGAWGWKGGVAPFDVPASSSFVRCAPCDPAIAEWDPVRAVCQCKEGTFGAVSTTNQECTKCPPGKFKATISNTFPESDACQLCPTGTYSRLEGSTQCLNCPKGSFTAQSGESTCTKCPHGKYKPETGPGACLLCGINADAVGEGNWKVDHCKCNAGYTGLSGVDACDRNATLAVLGEAACLARGCCKWVPGADICTSSVGDFACDKCEHCPSGTYKNVPGSSLCIECTYGKHDTCTSVADIRPYGV
jgi:hypothetical protein